MSAGISRICLKAEECWVWHTVAVAAAGAAGAAVDAGGTGSAICVVWGWLRWLLMLCSVV